MEKLNLTLSTKMKKNFTLSLSALFLIISCGDNKEEFDKYDLFRWKILRQPIGKSVQSLKDEHENSSFHLIGLIDKKIVACGRLHLNSPDEAQIRYMAVDDYHRGKGIGKQVVEELESYAKLKKVDSVILSKATLKFKLQLSV